MDATTIMILFICVCLCGFIIFISRVVEEVFDNIIELWTTIVEIMEDRENDA